MRAVDGLCGSRSWDELIDLAERCEDALERGKQLWPISAHIDYRLALEAPAEYAADVLQPEVGRFAPAPLTEVAAFSHEWAELAPHIEFSQAAAYVAQERILRGESLDDDDRAHGEILELPLHLESWEPTYALAHFHSDHVDVAEPWDPKASLPPAEARPAQPVEEPRVEDALLDLVTPWTNESNGAARAVVVDGDALGAASCLCGDRLRIGALDRAEAMQRIAWAAASGGAHGRRRGAALGRFMAWSLMALLAEVRWPAEPSELDDRSSKLSWYRWDEGEPEAGWVLRIAVENRDRGWAAALAATDLIAEDDAAD